MKKLLAILFIGLACGAVAVWRPFAAHCSPAGARPAVANALPAAAEIPSWGLGPFVRDDGADFIRPNPSSVFNCPVWKRPVPWEDQAVLCAAAIVKDNKVYILYRAEDSSRSRPAA
ncbi:MAG: hypothetical protein ABSC18_17535, partial [Verrucomicrobiota bacterium]